MAQWSATAHPPQDCQQSMPAEWQEALAETHEPKKTRSSNRHQIALEPLPQVGPKSVFPDHGRKRPLYHELTKKVCQTLWCFPFLLILGFPKGEAVIRITVFWGSLRDCSDSNHCVLGHSDSNHDTQCTQQPTRKKRGPMSAKNLNNNKQEGLKGLFFKGGFWGFPKGKPWFESLCFGAL